MVYKSAFSVRLLTLNDVVEYRELWLAALEEVPEAFYSALEEVENASNQTFTGKLEASTCEKYVLGAFDIDRCALMGILGFSRRNSHRLHHKADIGPMYVYPQFRRQGMAKRMMKEVIERARQLSSLEELELTVTVGNIPARRLYLSFGFTPYAITPRHIKVGSKRYNTEQLFLILTRSSDE